MAGEYRLGRLLGEGGFGAVYEAEHPLLKRRAAVKVLHRVAERDSDAVQRFISEARAVNQIRSRHIIDIFSFGTLSDGRHFYVMDLLEGEPLDRYLQRARRVSVETTLQLLQPIADALDLAHAAGIIHRDLKPQNIFLSWDQSDEVTPKLLDFGMAKLLSNSPVRTVSGTPIGTPLYMAPEQARGEKVDARCDVYALGVLCYEMLVGQMPFDGESTVAILMAHLIQAPERPSEVTPDLSPEFDAPLLAMLQKDPNARPSSAGEALTALRRAAERAGVSVPSGLPRLPRPEPRVPGEAENEVASTLLAPGLSSENGTQVSLQQRASAPRSQSRSPLRFVAGLALLGGAAAAWLATRSSPGPAASVSASAAPAVSVPAKQAEINAAASLSAAPAESQSPALASPSASSPVKRAKGTVEAKPKKKPEAAAASATPRDLESPFGP